MSFSTHRNYLMNVLLLTIVAVSNHSSIGGVNITAKNSDDYHDDK
jgi:hypothetical protein